MDKPFSRSAASFYRVTHILHYTEIDSTQRIAISLAKEGAADGIAVVSSHQTRGRGRGDHTWVSPDGGLYLSVVVHPDPMGLHLLSLASGIELLKMLSKESKRPLLVKWPNDIVTEEAGHMFKLAGIITDVVNLGGEIPVAVVGVGLNVKKVTLPPAVMWQAAFLDEVCASLHEVESLVGPVIEAIETAVHKVSEPDERALVSGELNSHLWGTGKEVSIDRTRGILLGVGEAGEAVLSTQTGKESFFSGELSPLEL